MKWYFKTKMQTGKIINTQSRIGNQMQFTRCTHTYIHDPFSIDTARKEVMNYTYYTGNRFVSFCWSGFSSEHIIKYTYLLTHVIMCGRVDGITAADVASTHIHCTMVTIWTGRRSYENRFTLLIFFLNCITSLSHSPLAFIMAQTYSILYS